MPTRKNNKKKVVRLVISKEPDLAALQSDYKEFKNLEKTLAGWVLSLHQIIKAHKTRSKNCDKLINLLLKEINKEKEPAVRLFSLLALSGSTISQICEEMKKINPEVSKEKADKWDNMYR